VIGFLSKPRLIGAFARPAHLVATNVLYGDGTDSASESAPWRQCDLYNDVSMTIDGSHKSVLVFVHGGVWTFGSKALYRFLGTRLAAEGYIVCICDYRRWSTSGGDSISQARDVAAVLKWSQTAALRRRLGLHALASGDAPPRVFLAGHSSGAHVCALAFCLDVALAGLCAGFIGLSGVYDVASHRDWEMGRGVHAVSMLDPANGGPYEWAARSPLRIVQSATRAAAWARRTAAAGRASSAASTARGALIDWRGLGHSVRFPRTLLVHGASDTTVPSVQSEMFCEALRAHRGGGDDGTGGRNGAMLLRLRAEEGGDHSTSAAAPS
jgi:acetyl esterase/lipase